MECFNCSIHFNSEVLDNFIHQKLPPQTRPLVFLPKMLVPTTFFPLLGTREHGNKNLPYSHLEFQLFLYYCFVVPDLYWEQGNKHFFPGGFLRSFCCSQIHFPIGNKHFFGNKNIYMDRLFRLCHSSRFYFVLLTLEVLSVLK